MNRTLALISLITLLAVPLLAADIPVADYNDTVEATIGESDLELDTDGEDNTGNTFTFTINAASTDGTTGSTGSGHVTGATVTVPDLESDLDSAEEDIEAAKDLIDSDPDAAGELLGSATTTQKAVNTIMNTDVTELNTEIGVFDVDELDLSKKDIAKGIDYLEEAKELIADAEDEEDLEKRADLLEDALKLQRKAVELLPEVEKIAEDSDTAEISSASVEEALESATTDAAKEILEAIADAIPAEGTVTIDRSFKTYQVSNTEDTTDKVYRTKIFLTITAGNDLREVIIVEVIPKSVAAEVSEIIFGTSPKVLQEDPIVQWTITDLAKGKTMDLSYVVKSKVLSLDSQTLAKTTGGEGEGPVAEVEGEVEIPTEEKEEEKEIEIPKISPIAIVGIIILVILAIAYYLFKPNLSKK